MLHLIMNFFHWKVIFIVKCVDIIDSILYEPVNNKRIFIEDTLGVFSVRNSMDEKKDDYSVKKELEFIGPIKPFRFFLLRSWFVFFLWGEVRSLLSFEVEMLKRTKKGNKNSILNVFHINIDSIWTTPKHFCKWFYC